MLNLLINDVLGTPAILVGSFSSIGLLLQKKSLSEIVSGTLKTIMGFLILTIGADVISRTLTVFSALFEHAFSIHGVVTNTDVTAALAQKDFGTQTATIMICGMVVNIVLARLTPLKYIFLTGHHILYLASMLAIVLSAGGLSHTAVILTGSVILGVWMVLSPALLQPFTRQITGNDDLALGHFGSIGYLVSAMIGKWVGKGSKSIEELNVPRSLDFLRDSSVSISIVMTILFIVLVLTAGQTFTENQLSGSRNFIVFALLQGIMFAAGVYTILAGVRMVIAEIVPAFHGIANKAVKNARPALDCPMVFPFAPNAVIIGFLSSFSAGVISMVFCPLFGLSVIVPGLVPHFFCGATAGVYGNATGGRRGAVIGAFVHGVIISFLPALLLPVMGRLGFASITFGDADFAVIGIVLGRILSLIN